MSEEKEKLLFVATNPFGYKIVLASDRYYKHIISSDNNHQAHPEFTPSEIKQALEDPQVIYESDRPDMDVYFSRSCLQYPRMFLKVAVENYKDCGNVSTAFLTPEIDGGIKVEGGLKYAKYKSIL